MSLAFERAALAIPSARLERVLRHEKKIIVRAAAGRLDAALLRGADLAVLAETAARLGMLGHVSLHVEDLRRGAVPEEWLASLAEACRAQAAFNLLLAHTEAEWLAALAARGIQAIPLKGVSLSRILYGSPAVRSTTDVDLLVSGGQMSAAAEMFEERGYHSALPRALLLRPAFLEHTDEHTAETVYFAEAGGIPLQVELHWKILPLPEAAVWTALTEYDAAGGPVRGLSPAHYLLYLCAHLAGHGWRSLHWLVDIAAFLQKFSDRVDATEFSRLCHRTGLHHRAGVTFVLLEEYFGIRWEAGKGLDTPRARRTAESVLLRPLEPAVTPGVIAVHGERLRLQDSAARRLGYLWWLAHPTREEWAREDGSVRSAAAAWATRAARLVRLVTAGASASTREEEATNGRADSRATAPHPAAPQAGRGGAA